MARARSAFVNRARAAPPNLRKNRILLRESWTHIASRACRLLPSPWWVTAAAGMYYGAGLLVLGAFYYRPHNLICATGKGLERMLLLEASARSPPHGDNFIWVIEQTLDCHVQSSSIARFYE